MTKELVEHRNAMSRRVLPFKILNEAFKFGTGLYVGLMDGQGVVVEPLTKYLLLGSPTALSGAFWGVVSYQVQRTLRQAVSDRQFFEDNLERLIVEEKREEIRNIVTGVAQADITKKLPQLVGGAMGRTALKTGAGYAAGYFLAKLF